MSIKLDQFSVVGVKPSLLNRMVEVKGLPKKEYTFKELYQLLVSQKGKQDEIALKNSLIKVAEKDVVFKKGLIELLSDDFASTMAPLVGKEEVNLCKKIIKCIRANKVKDVYVLSDLGMTFIRGILFKNSQQFMQLRGTFPPNAKMIYEQYTGVRRAWLKMCEVIYYSVKNSTMPGKKEVLKSLCYGCDRMMTAFSQNEVPDYRPIEKMLNFEFYNFLSYPHLSDLMK